MRRPQAYLHGVKIKRPHLVGNLRQLPIILIDSFSFVSPFSLTTTIVVSWEAGQHSQFPTLGSSPLPPPMPLQLKTYGSQFKLRCLEPRAYIVSEQKTLWYIMMWNLNLRGVPPFYSLFLCPSADRCCSRVELGLNASEEDLSALANACDADVGTLGERTMDHTRFSLRLDCVFRAAGRNQ